MHYLWYTVRYRGIQSVQYCIALFILSQCLQYTDTLISLRPAAYTFLYFYTPVHYHHSLSLYSILTKLTACIKKSPVEWLLSTNLQDKQRSPMQKYKSRYCCGWNIHARIKSYEILRITAVNSTTYNITF